MSLYNFLFGVNNRTPALLKCLGINSPHEIPRFRDCFLEEGFIAIYTRTGGGNRDFYENEEVCRLNYPEEFQSEESPAGPWNDDLRQNKYYVRDCDCDFDCTYAYFYFRFPDEFAADLWALCRNEVTHSPSEKWEKLFKELKKPLQ